MKGNLKKINLKVGIKALLICIFILLIYYDALSYMIHVWIHNQDYQHCFLIPLVSLYMIWERREELKNTPVQPSWWGLIPFAFAIFLYFLGEFGAEYLTLQMSFWWVIVALISLNMGKAVFKTVFFPLIFLTLMFPLPAFFHNRLSLNLQLLSSQLGMSFMRLFGIPAFREGNIIDLGVTQLQVVEACSGLRYLFPLMTLGLICAYFFKEKLWKRVLIFCSTIPMAVLFNGLRIGITGILADKISIKVAEGFFHGFSGWVLFMAAFLVLVIEMWILGGVKLQLWKRENKNIKKGVTVGYKIKKISPHYLASVFILGFTFLASHGISYRSEVPALKPFNTFPMKIDSWKGIPQAMGGEFIKALDLSDYVLADYYDTNGNIVNLYVAYYEKQTKGEAIHSPASCLPGAGWQTRFKRILVIPIQHFSDGFPVVQMVMQKGNEKQLVFYWFQQRGRIIVNEYLMKFYLFWDALTKHRTDGALVRLSTPIYKNEDIQEAQKRLVDFTERIVPILDEFIPRKKLS